MVLENEPILFLDWFWPAFLFFVKAGALLGAIALVVGYVVSAFRYGPLGGGDVTYRVIRRALVDLVSQSGRRIMALAWLAVQESLRRMVLIGFAVFGLILLFAGWFLDTQSNDPATLYLSFVLTATTYLVLLMALFLSAFSLPADIKNHTIYTIVTKPVRPGEIVLGRILGFSAIGTAMLIVMGVLSYFFVERMLSHSHEIEVASLTAAPGETGDRVGRTTLAQNHRHEVTMHSDGTGETDIAQGHYHLVESREDDGKTVYTVGPPRDMLTARVPHYGKLRFTDRWGKGRDRGISVGSEWKYRSYIDGATLATAIFKFTDVTEEKYPNGILPVEMTIRVFRSYKGDIEKGILGSLVLKNPRTGRASQLQTFTAKDFLIDHRDISRELVDPSGTPIDLFDDLVDNGELEIHLQCLDAEQYFGVAQPDIYLRARDSSFAVNFIKSYLGIWVQMLLVTSFGVMFSTFLSGPVAMMATLAALVIGFFTQFVIDVAQGTVEGGGPAESLVRLLKQQNVTTQMEPGLTRDVVQAMDSVFMFMMTSVTSLLPDFRRYSNVDYLAHGFDIPPDVLWVQIVSGLAYVAVVFFVGYFFLRTREVAR